MYFVSFTNAVTDPGTVVVVSSNTVIALSTMLSSYWDFQVTNGAVLQLYEWKDALTIIFLFLFNYIHRWVGRIGLFNRSVLPFWSLCDWMGCGGCWLISFFFQVVKYYFFLQSRCRSCIHKRAFVFLRASNSFLHFFKSLLTLGIWIIHVRWDWWFYSLVLSTCCRRLRAVILIT